MKSKRQSNIFHFKKFSVRHDRSGLKVGTDAVLLGAWVNTNHTKRILDIGTGSGVIALMLAQRTEEDTIIDAVEIEKADAAQARENILNSPWPGKVVVHQQPIQEFNPGYKFDLVISNPPYFVNSLLSPTAARTQARHTQSLSFAELVDHSLRLLKPNGRLAVILPFAEGNKFKLLAETKLHLVRETAFQSRREKPKERLLFELGMESSPVHRDELILYESGEQKSDAYINLTKDFYL